MPKILGMTKKPHWVPLVTLGPHYEWSGDGHDKLNAIGFPVWGIRDVWSGKWLGLWVVPNNHLGEVVAYLYLSVVECGANREAFALELPMSELPAHKFLHSINNTTIEWGWLHFHLQWGDKVEKYNYNSNDPVEYELIQWLWPMVIQAELDWLHDHFNNHHVHKDHVKENLSGVSPNVAMALLHKYNGQNCLQIVDTTLIHQLKEELGGADLIRFVSVEFAQCAQAVFDTLHLMLSLENVWAIFWAMRQIMKQNK
ncbi:hypothetical protein K439DRAFT_1649708 [Ramaria rubella]|nr:hypothetical protein K439DRAFT_1649708 [Ramaria rubella]